MLYIIGGGIVLFFILLAVLFMVRNSQTKKIVVTKQEFLHDSTSPTHELSDVSALIPHGDQAQATPAGTTSALRDISDTPTTQTTTVQKAWQFFTQAMTIPWVLMTSTFPSSATCGKSGQPVCPTTPNAITVVTDQTTTTHISIIEQVFNIPVSIQDNLQDLIFYKFIAVIQQYMVTTESYPVQQTPEDTTWLTQLIQTKELTPYYYNVFTSTTPAARLCGTTLQEGFCYESNGKVATLYIRQRTPTNECPNGSIKSWVSDENTLQITCFPSVSN